jgi:hypothetical protein
MNVGSGRQIIIILFGSNEAAQFRFWKDINLNQTFVLDSQRPFICSVAYPSYVSRWRHLTPSWILFIYYNIGLTVPMTDSAAMMTSPNPSYLGLSVSFFRLMMRQLIPRVSACQASCLIWQPELRHLIPCYLQCKKRLAIFPSPAVMSRTFFYSVGLPVPIVWNYGHDDIIHDQPVIFRPVSACYRYRGHDDVTRSRRRRWSEGHRRRWWVPSWV